jgi:hypothetical protein
MHPASLVSFGTLTTATTRHFNIRGNMDEALQVPNMQPGSWHNQYQLISQQWPRDSTLNHTTNSKNLQLPGINSLYAQQSNQGSYLGLISHRTNWGSRCLHPLHHFSTSPPHPAKLRIFLLSGQSIQCLFLACEPLPRGTMTSGMSGLHTNRVVWMKMN